VLLPWDLNFHAVIGSRLFVMVRFLRTALLWLALLALPIQGMAGTMMLICVSNGHAMDTSSAQTRQRDRDEMPARSMASDPACASADDAADPSKINCATGSVCFASVALPASRLDMPAAVSAVAPTSFVPGSPIGFYADGPDRPPRPSFA
jgi:hypothetical protein